MKGFLLTHKGMEDIASLEVKELIGKESEKMEGCIIFGISSYEDLFKLCYISQSASGIFLLLKKFDYSDLSSDLEKNIESIDFSEWLSQGTSFRVKCRKYGEEESPTPEIERKLGEIIINNIQKKSGYRQKVDLENPEIAICAYLAANQCCIGIDFAGFDLSKRYYKIFSGPSSIRGTLAYFLVRLSSYSKKDALLDCLSGSGIVPIEAALFALGFPVNFYSKEKFAFMKIGKFSGHNFKAFFAKIDSKIAKAASLSIYSVDTIMKHVQFAKKNSKIAGVDKKLTFSRMDLEWLDTKFKKHSINKIVTRLPESRKKDLNKVYKEFFYQAEFILSENGKMVVMGSKELVEKYSSEFSFLISDSREVFSGSKKYDVFVLSRK